jgi:uncharacterized protein (TIGR02246 family)
MPAFRPLEVHTQFVEAFKRGDIEALAALYEPDAVFVTGRGTAKGRDEIREAYRQILSDGAEMELETRAVVESGDGLAILHGAWELRRDGLVSSGLSTEVIRRQGDGTWLFVMDEPRTPGSA